MNDREAREQGRGSAAWPPFGEPREVRAGDTRHLRGLLAHPRVALPHFGTLWQAGRIADYVDRHWSEQAASPARLRLVAAGPDGEGLIGAASIVDGNLSYFVDPDHWGQGVAGRLVRALCERARATTPAPGVFALIQRENTASVRVTERAGFRFAGLRHARCRPHQTHALLYYVLPPP